mgnify:FL=1
MGRYPSWLYFDSKLTTYEELSQITQKKCVSFVTIRRRGSNLLKRLENMPSSAWHDAVIDIPKRRHQKIRYIDEHIKLPGYDGKLRQVAVTDLGRKHPTLFLTNNDKVTARDVVINYARRNGIEDALGSSVNFFHQD